MYMITYINYNISEQQSVMFAYTLKMILLLQFIGIRCALINVNWSGLVAFIIHEVYDFIV